MPIVIIEGVDGGGKSTLAEEIQRIAPRPASIAHLGPPASPDTAIDECLDPLIIADADSPWR